MFRAKLAGRAVRGLVVLGGLFALGTLATSTASAGEWDVGGTRLIGSAAIASPSVVLSHGQLQVPVAGVTIECLAPEFHINGGEIVAPDELRAKDLTFLKCSTGSSGNCSLANENILTLAIHGLAELDGTLGTLIRLLPLPSKTISVLRFEGASCALLGVQPVTGRIDLLLPTGKDPSVLQLILAYSLFEELRIGANEATLSGFTGDIKLTSGKTWNFL